jgi:hypothetical protein
MFFGKWVELTSFRGKFYAAWLLLFPRGGEIVHGPLLPSFRIRGDVKSRWPILPLAGWR